MLDLKMIIKIYRINIIYTIQTIREGNKILMKRIMDKKTLMKMEKMNKKKMMNTARKKTRIWMNKVKMIQIIK